MSKKVTVTKAYIDSLKAERDHLKKERDELAKDLNKHRDYWLYIYRETTKMHGRGETFRAAWLLESMAKHFNNVKQWYWG